MTAVATELPPKSISDLEIVEMFARKTIQTGEYPVVRPLWNNHYRINYWKRSNEGLSRSLFVTVSGGKIEMPDKQ